MMRFHKMYAGLLVAAAMMVIHPCLAQDASTLPFQKSDSKPVEANTLKPGANSFAQSQARTLLESQGYSEVSTLVNDPDGIWRGTAQKDNRKVNVSVDFQGHVAAK